MAEKQVEDDYPGKSKLHHKFRVDRRGNKSGFVSLLYAGVISQ